MEDKQWFIVKLAGAILTLFILVSSSIGAANMFFDLKRDVVRNEKTIVEHKKSDEKLMDKAFSEIDENKDDIHAIEIQNGRIETMLTDILQRLEKGEANDLRILDILNNFEVVE